MSQIDHRLGSTPGSGTQPAGYGYTWNDGNQLTDVDFLPSVYNSEDASFGYDDWVQKGQPSTAASNRTLATVTWRVWHRQEVQAGQLLSSEIIRPRETHVGTHAPGTEPEHDLTKCRT